MKHKEINLSSASLDKNVVKVNEEPREEKKKSSLKKKIDSLIEKFKAWWAVAPKHKKILVIAIPAILLLGGSTFFFYWTIYGPRNRPPQLVSFDTNYIAPKMRNLSDFDLIALSKPSLPRTEESPINGRLFTREEMEKLQEKTPIAVMVSNHVHARPASNLSQADVVYEALVEGGITRLLAIYWSREPNKVGPIRSARQYYLEWLSPYDPIFVYDGFAMSDNPKVDAAGNITKYGLKSMYVEGAWRVADRVSPHNEYSSTVRTWEIAEARGWTGLPQIQSWNFKSDARVDDRNDRFEGKISFSNSEQYNVTWEYEKDTNMYYRYIGGISDVDLETGQQISAKNVIVQEVKVEGPVDSYNRLIITTTGTGPVAVLQDGKVIYGKWKKDDRTSRTQFYDNNDNKIELNRGVTWISAVRNLQSNFDIME